MTRRPACALSGSAVRGLCVAERLVDGVGEVGHRVELLVVGPLLSGFGSGSPAGAVVTAVDPDRRQAFPLDRDVVVEQALRDVQEVGAGQPEFGVRSKARKWFSEGL